MTYLPVIGIPPGAVGIEDAPLVAAIQTAITAADHMVPIAESGPTAIAASAHAHVAIPAGAKSYSVGTLDATFALALVGYSLPSDATNTHHGPVTSLSDAVFIPALLEDGATAPTHVSVYETGAVGGTFWIQWFK